MKSSRVVYSTSLTRYKTLYSILCGGGDLVSKMFRQKMPVDLRTCLCLCVLEVYG